MEDQLLDFVRSRVPFLKHVFRTWHASSDKNRRDNEKYCFKQAFFYAAAHYMKWRPYLSEGAIAEATRLEIINHLPSARWVDQPKFDPGRKVFHFEHVFTGTMCWNMIDGLRDRLDAAGIADEISQLFQQNYAIAWILNSENVRLPKSDRGTTLADALRIYERHRVKLKR